MGVFKIFPEKDATIYSISPNKNSGLDEILEISTKLNTLQVGNASSSTAEASRALLKFPQSDINSIVSVASASGNYKAYLKLFLANASAIPTDFTVFANMLSYDWTMGTGKESNLPQTIDGVSWTYRNISGSWLTSSFTAGQTGSYRTGGNAGGGVWYLNPSASQSFTPYSSKDVEMDITNFVVSWYSSSAINNGLILKHSSSNEFNTSSIFELKYFSRDTHTIYPPHLEVRWADVSYITGSSSIVDNNSIVVSLGNNPGTFKEASIHKFRINVRDKFPTRQFSTSSVYLNNKILPSSSYWSIKDLHTEEVIIDFDINYTSISADASGSYFNVYMNGLEPLRNYKFVFKTIIGSETLVIDDNYYFKIVK